MCRHAQHGLVVEATARLHAVAELLGRRRGLGQLQEPRQPLRLRRRACVAARVKHHRFRADGAGRKH